MNPTEINERFFNFDRTTVANIQTFHRSPDPALVQPIFDGIMRKYLPEAGRRDDPEEVSLNAFGLESLTLLEVVLDLQDALGIRLEDDEIRGLHDLKEVHALLVQKVDALRGGVPPAAAS